MMLSFAAEVQHNRAMEPGDRPKEHRAHLAERHGNWNSGAARAGVFGMSDGLVSNLSLVAGIAGASVDRPGVVVGGLAGLVAGALSMAVGEYVSVRANAELLHRELAVERQEIEDHPQCERRELVAIYVERGLDPADADIVATKLMADPDVAL